MSDLLAATTLWHREVVRFHRQPARVLGAVGMPLLFWALIGSGLSGLFAARTLLDHGHKVQVFEKMNRPGGRIATHTDLSYAFDNGAQYFTTRDDRLQRYVQSWQTDGIVQPWR